MKKFFERLHQFRRKVKLLNGRGFVQLTCKQTFDSFCIRPLVTAVPRYSRFHENLDFERAHGYSFKDTLITKPKPYVHKFPYGPCTSEQISNYINERAGLL